MIADLSVLSQVSDLTNPRPRAMPASLGFAAFGQSSGCATFDCAQIAQSSRSSACPAGGVLCRRSRLVNDKPTTPLPLACVSQSSYPRSKRTCKAQATVPRCQTQNSMQSSTTVEQMNRTKHGWINNDKDAARMLF